ncbi:MAG: prepilin-type N-terminal cleavage/methylation domain-containing protein [Kiloniellaceae bacterium]
MSHRLRAYARTRRGGFTLIELLVALTLLGLLSVGLFGGLRFGTRAWEVGESRAAALAEIEAVQGLLRRQIAQAMPPTIRVVGESLSQSSTFEGAAERLRFVSLVPARAVVGGLYQIELAIVDGAAGQRLDFVWRLYRPDEVNPLEGLDDEAETATGGRRVLLKGLEGAEFAYYGLEDGARVARWHDTWDGRMGLPRLIALKAAFADAPDRLGWPELVVHPRLARAEEPL